MAISDIIDKYFGILSAVVTIATFLESYYGFSVGLVTSFIASAVVLLFILLYNVNSLNKKIYLLYKSNKAISDALYDTAKDYVNKNVDGDKFIKDLIHQIFKAMKKQLDDGQAITFGKLSPPELHELLEKYKNGTLTYNEAVKLRELLEAEKKQRESQGDIATVILIGLLLFAVLAIIMGDKKK